MSKARPVTRLCAVTVAVSLYVFALNKRFTRVSRSNPSCSHIGRGDRVELDPDDMLCKRQFLDRLKKTTDFDTLFYNTSIELEYNNSIIGTPFQPLQNFQNPCWVSSSNGVHHSPPSATDSAGPASGQDWRLRCFPGIFLLGFAKCGSTDLYNGLMKHPMVKGGKVKESAYWAWRRLALFDEHVKVPDTFSQYIDDYDDAASEILAEGNRESGEERPTGACLKGDFTSEACLPINKEHYYKGLTVDGTPSNIYLYDGWERMPGHVNLQEPRVLLAHTIHAIYPQAKFIIMLRNPTDRAYSHFRQRSRYDPVSVFHEDMKEATAIWRGCLRRRTLKSCLYNSTLYSAGRHFLGGSYLRPSLYAAYLQDWLEIFPREQFHFIKSEDYYADRSKALSGVLDFLGLEQLSTDELQTFQTEPVANPRKSKGLSRQPMEERTRRMLDQFYEPYTRELARLLKDEKFSWS